MSPDKKRREICPQHLYSPEKRVPWKWDDLLDIEPTKIQSQPVPPKEPEPVHTHMVVERPPEPIVEKKIVLPPPEAVDDKMIRIY